MDEKILFYKLENNFDRKSLWKSFPEIWVDLQPSLKIVEPVIYRLCWHIFFCLSRQSAWLGHNNDK
jgi:hypothetical protein